MGAGAVNQLTLGYKASNAALTKYTIVKLNDDDTIETATAVGDLMIGVVQTDALANEKGVRVQVSGITNVKAGGAIIRGSLVTTNSTGQGIATTTATNRVIGIALKAAVSGDYFPVLLRQGIV